MKSLQFSFLVIFYFAIMVMADKKSCNDVTKKYEKCISNINGVDFDAMCKTYSSSECQELFTSPKTVLKDCDDIFIENTVSGLSKIVNILEYSCTRDESNNYCPLASIIQKIQLSAKSLENNDFSKVFEPLKGSCSSKKCLKVSIAYLKSINDMSSRMNNINKKEIQDIDDLLSYLNKCSSTTDSTTDNTNKNNNNNNNENKNNNNDNKGNKNSNNNNNNNNNENKNNNNDNKGNKNNNNNNNNKDQNKNTSNNTKNNNDKVNVDNKKPAEKNSSGAENKTSNGNTVTNDNNTIVNNSTTIDNAGSGFKFGNGTSINEITSMSVSKAGVTYAILAISLIMYAFIVYY